MVVVVVVDTAELTDNKQRAAGLPGINDMYSNEMILKMHTL